jgi:hypothetical protein
MASYIFKLFQTCLLIFNTFYFLIGIAFVLVSISFYINTTNFNELIKQNHSNEYYLLLYGLVTCGFIYVSVGLIGCVGGVKRNLCLIFIYFTLLLIIFSLQFTLCVCIYLKSNDFFDKFLKKFNDSIKLYYGANNLHTKAIDQIQSQFKCCGWLSPQDWFYSVYDARHNARPSPISQITTTRYVSSNLQMNGQLFNLELLNKIPYSCCLSEFESDCVLMNKFYEIGCERPLKIYYQQIEIYTIWLLACLTILQLVLLILSLYLLCISWANKKHNKNNSIDSESSTSSSISLSDLNDSNKPNQYQTSSYFL